MSIDNKYVVKTYWYHHHLVCSNCWQLIKQFVFLYKTKCIIFLINISLGSNSNALKFSQNKKNCMSIFWSYMNIMNKLHATKVFMIILMALLLALVQEPLFPLYIWKCISLCKKINICAKARRFYTIFVHWP